jgi:nucleotide-binding universal stress UspA family protein
MKLLVAADGSGRLRSATLPAIANLADDVVPDVTVLHVLRAASEAWSDEELHQVLAERRHRLEALVADADFAVQLLIETLPYGDEVPRYLALRARDLGVDAIVVTTRRATGMMASLLGSVAQGVLRESPVPVLVVRPSDDDEEEEEED